MPQVSGEHMVPSLKRGTLEASFETTERERCPGLLRPGWVGIPVLEAREK